MLCKELYYIRVSEDAAEKIENYFDERAFEWQKISNDWFLTKPSLLYSVKLRREDAILITLTIPMLGMANISSKLAKSVANPTQSK